MYKLCVVHCESDQVKTEKRQTETYFKLSEDFQYERCVFCCESNHVKREKSAEHQM